MTSYEIKSDRVTARDIDSRASVCPSTQTYTRDTSS